MEEPRSSGEVWKLIWGLSVPNKVRNFLWRACRDALLVKRNLQKQKILQSDCCDHCRSAPESVLHVLWECSSISQVWSSLSEFNFYSQRSFTTISNLIVHAQKEEKDVGKLAMVMWTLCFIQICVDDDIMSSVSIFSVESLSLVQPFMLHFISKYFARVDLQLYLAAAFNFSIFFYMNYFLLPECLNFSIDL